MPLALSLSRSFTLFHILVCPIFFSRSFVLTIVHSFPVCVPVEYKNINVALRSIAFNKNERNKQSETENILFKLSFFCVCISTRNGYNNVSSIVVGKVMNTHTERRETVEKIRIEGVRASEK